jgi:PAS domain S-box-containing protein
LHDESATAALSEDAYASIASALACVAQPVWLVDHAGVIRFANSAAVAALGYTSLRELEGKPSHETIHYKHADGSPFPVEKCPMLSVRETGQSIHLEDWFVRRDGSMLPVEYWSGPLETPAGRGAVVAFTDVAERRQIEQVLRERDTILESLGQPVFVTDHSGLIRYANPAAVAALGFEHISELVGQNGHWLVHYKRPDGSPFPIEECQFTRARGLAAAIQEGEDWFVRKDGSMVPLSYTAAPIETPQGFGTAIAFTDVQQRREAEQAARERDIARARAEELAASEARQRAILEAALDCVISMDENGCVRYFNAAAERTFGYSAADVIGRELADTIVPPSLREQHREGLARHLATGERRVLGRRIEITAMRADGSEFPVELTVSRSDAAGTPGFTGYVRDITETKRAEEELVATRLREKVVADEQAALRRVATLVARGAAPNDVFGAVCRETGQLLDATNVNLAHFTADDMNLTIAGWSLRDNHVPTGTRLPLQGDSTNVIVRRTQATARVNSYEGAAGELATVLRSLGIRSEVAAPVVVDGDLWGALIVGSDKHARLPHGTEERVARFAELIALAVSNAAARSDLIAARRRVIAAADVARAGVTRDLHDGAQQQFINTVLNLQLAQEKWSSAPERAQELVELALKEAQVGIDGLRDLAAGIHPAILTNRGLAAAIEALAVRLPLPVDLDVEEGRLAQQVEASVYFFCSEALTNIVKHAQASLARVAITRGDALLTVEIRDDGIGGAVPRPQSSGLLGLHDRIASLDGELEISSPSGEGTILRARIPLLANAVEREDALSS